MTNSTDSDRLYLSQVIGALSYALDLTEGQPAGHCLRGCWIGMHVGRELGMEGEELYDLYYTLLLKDSGCSSNAARLSELYGSDDIVTKHDVKLVNVQNAGDLARFVVKHTGMRSKLRERFGKLWHLIRHGDTLAQELVSARCTRGAAIAIELGFRTNVADGIYSLDEHWNGKGRPEGRQGETIPLGSRISLVAQVVDVFHQAGGRQASLDEVRKRAGTWFDPRVVEALERAAQCDEFWEALTADDIEQRVQALEPEQFSVELSEARLDSIAVAFAQIIDAKSPFTSGHSERVAEYALKIGRKLGFSGERLGTIRRGALLHDIGKLGVSNSILDKPGKLDEEEWAQMRKHPTFTEEILSRINPFRSMATMAADHHEKLDGSGYPKAISAEEIALESRIITIADIYDALIADRPYRAGMPQETALGILHSMMENHEVDAQCLTALLHCLRDGDMEAAA